MKGYYKPLPHFVTISQSGIHGLGLFSTKFLEKGKVLGITHVSHGEFEDGYIRTPLGGFINHSKKNYNLESYELNGLRYAKTTRDVKNGEELTLCYTLYDPENGESAIPETTIHCSIN
tara:strand:+ start:2786 stop:3139 length:354 start_codon:yes stop_codon:yes gene_type:complete